MKTHLLRPTKGISRTLTKSYTPEVSPQQKRHSHSPAKFSTSSQFLDSPSQDLRAATAKARKVEREFLLTLLKSAPTKRDAKSYISQFELPEESEASAKESLDHHATPLPDSPVEGAAPPNRTGVNLGSLYNARAIRQSPVFSQQPLPQRASPRKPNTVHIALVKLRQPQSLDDATLSGIGLTLGQLVRLGLNIVVVVDCQSDTQSEQASLREWEHWVFEQTDRVVAAIASHNAPGAMKVSNALTQRQFKQEIPSTVHIRGSLEVENSNLLTPLLNSSMVVVIPPIAVAVDGTAHRVTKVEADDVMLALTKKFSGIMPETAPPVGYNKHTERLAQSDAEKTALDRVIILDPLGGIPSNERPDKAHVFINVEEEYDLIKQELGDSDRLNGTLLKDDSSTRRTESATILGPSNPFSTFVEREVISPTGNHEKIEETRTDSSSPSQQHTKNLDLIQKALRILPPSSSGLIITPAAAAISSQMEEILPLKATGVRTRRLRNPLIHNLLTDKPMVSSSLPLSRFLKTATSSDEAPNQPTFFKRGIPVTMIPDPRQTPWHPDSPQSTTLTLRDPSIDFPRLLHLIEDSFGRPLDVDQYLKRIEGRIAGIIIAGAYEGGAICTWETPPNFPNSPPVPYLDKFAVLRRAQGTGGVADIVFRALLRTCFPNGCVWRSRTSNPVNKWYMERSTGSWKLPGGQWTMFWTQEGVRSMHGQDGEEYQRWRDWVDVCTNVQPTWLDGKPPD